MSNHVFWNAKTKTIIDIFRHNLSFQNSRQMYSGGQGGDRQGDDRQGGGGQGGGGVSHIGAGIIIKCFLLTCLVLFYV